MSSFQLECSVLKKSWGNLLFGENEMTREKLEKYIQNNYSAEPDYPWVKYPDYEVFRHTSNKKWFALIMEIPKDKLGLQTKDILSVVNFKCDPIMIGACKLWDAGEKGLTLSAFEWEKDRKTLIYGQVDYMYGEALYKPEMKEGNPIRLYSLDEIMEIFCKLGLRICNSFADFSGKPSFDNDIQLMVYSIRE